MTLQWMETEEKNVRREEGTRGQSRNNCDALIVLILKSAVCTIITRFRIYLLVTVAVNVLGSNRRSSICFGILGS